VAILLLPRPTLTLLIVASALTVNAVNVPTLVKLLVTTFDASVTPVKVFAGETTANDAVVGVNVIDVAADAVVAKEADVILPLKLPVLICTELETVPAGSNVLTWVELLTTPTGTFVSVAALTPYIFAPLPENDPDIDVAVRLFAIVAEPDTVKLPDNTVLPETVSPLRATNSLAIDYIK
jgi:hypothetical protein